MRTLTIAYPGNPRNPQHHHRNDTAASKQQMDCLRYEISSTNDTQTAKQMPFGGPPCVSCSSLSLLPLPNLLAASPFPLPPVETSSRRHSQHYRFLRISQNPVFHRRLLAASCICSRATFSSAREHRLKIHRPALPGFPQGSEGWDKAKMDSICAAGQSATSCTE
jgi:hypothetical protein